MGCRSQGNRFSSRYADNEAMDEQEFKNRVDEALDDLYRRLTKAAEQHDFEADFNSGALAIEFESPPAKFVVSPNSPVKQIWVSAHTRSFKLDWKEEIGEFVLPETGQTLLELMEWAVGEQLDEEVIL